MIKLIIASRNKGKIKEVKAILSNLLFKLKTLDDVGFVGKIPERGKTFVENATIKAKTVGSKTGLLTLAEDSGLEVDALNGKPGILSARYVRGSDLDRIKQVLLKLKGIPKEKRTAKFKSVVAIYLPPTRRSGKPRFNRGALRVDSGLGRNDKGQIYTFEGSSEGLITKKPMGKNGFGYDPIFYNLDLGKTNAQATQEEKNRVSHRAKALEKAKSILKRLAPRSS